MCHPHVKEGPLAIVSVVGGGHACFDIGVTFGPSGMVQISGALLVGVWPVLQVGMGRLAFRVCQRSLNKLEASWEGGEEEGTTGHLNQ